MKTSLIPHSVEGPTICSLPSVDFKFQGDTKPW